MSSNTSDSPKLYTYLCLLPDFAEGSKRMSVRPQHRANAKKHREEGSLINSGATFSEDISKSTDGVGKMDGTWMLIRAESLEKAREFVSDDVYATGGAWDLSKATIRSIAYAQQ
ncbi:MAG: hypothetical protein CYPHOPRED_003116 [Cyphobasidiales sp. Tagirdzhanova-0007]|nr:MAG: hypothetical protein CYPHOPRED_003116 [Cyphobasidiales sp. Tagirdzhanova-0007]